MDDLKTASAIGSANIFNKSDIILTGEILGQGSYAIVLLGKKGEKKLAVKILKNPLSSTNLNDELKLMLKIKHYNVLKLEGYLEKGFDDKPNLILEYMPNGSLLEYVKTNHLNKEIQISFCCDVVAGMQHLHEKNIIHRDLAARNVLISEKRHAKVSDFGLSKIFIPNDNISNYTLAVNWKIPVRWSPKESIQSMVSGGSTRRQSKFIKASDVWSFGITMYELFTSGRIPYQENKLPFTNKKVLEVINNGKNPLDFDSLDEQNEILKILNQIFLEDYTLRPTFFELGKKFKNVQQINKHKPGSFCDVDSLSLFSETNWPTRIDWKQFLGKGSFGWVFKSIPTMDSKSIIRAIKIFFGDNEKNREEWSKEVNNIRNFDHENIVKNFSMQVKSLTLTDMEKLAILLPNTKEFQEVHANRKEVIFNFIEMELCGISLKQWLTDINSERTFCKDGIRFNICQQIKIGIKFLHSKSIIHRDLKPANICFSSKNMDKIKICDFGQFRFHKRDESETMTMSVGSKLYRAPELESGKYGETVDIFSFGIILFEIFHRHLIENFDQCAKDIKNGNGEKVELQIEDIPDLKSHILDYTSKDVEQRKTFYCKNIEYNIPINQWYTKEKCMASLSSILEFGQIPQNFVNVFDYSLNQDKFSKLFEKTALQPFKLITNWTLHDVKILLKIFHESTNAPKFINICSPWSSEVGNHVQIISYSDYVQMKALQSLPKISEPSHLFGNLMPFILQNVKMSDSTCVQSKFLYDFKITKNKIYMNRSDDDSDEEIQIKKYSLSRLDLIVSLLSVVDEILAIDIVQILGQFPMTLPLVMPNIDKNSAKTHLVTIPWLQNITVKRGTKSGEIQEGKLFQSPFKIILAIRSNSKTRTTVGKSAILNGLFKTDFMFSSSLEPGARMGLPYSNKNGSVEVAWLTTESCKQVLWELIEKELYELSCNDIISNIKSDDNKDEQYIIANLHGDVQQSCEIIKFLSPIVNAFLVFHFTDSLKYAYVHVLKNDCSNLPQFEATLQKENRIQLNPSDFNVQNKISSKICDAFKSGDLFTKFDISKLKYGNDLGKVTGTYNQKSQILIDFILKKKCSEFKEELWLLNLSSDDIPTDFTKIYDNNVLMMLSKMMKEILSLPLKERQIAISHVEQQLSIHSGNDSKLVRLKLLKFKQQRSEVFKTIAHQDRKFNQKLIRLDKKINKIAKELERNNLGLEHLLREIGKIYAIGLHNKECQIYMEMQFPIMIKRLAELVVEGQVVEVVDGDLGEISGVWLNAVLKEVSSILGPFRLFVISILGLQSSGKSTLLNCLFGCKFSVSSGRCTRGLFMRLLYIDPKLRKEINYDGIILIDTEGLCAPEKMMDLKADLRDREMATYAMLVSNLTLINIMGETMKEMTDILQIVVVTMARLEKVEVTADVLLVQHCSEVVNSKFQNATTEFCKALRQAIDVTDKQFTALGIINSACLKKLVERVENHQLLQLFHSYKSGSTANASPSIDYHDDCVVFYQKILDVMKDASLRWNFNEWYNLLQTYWTALQKQDFSLKFKNIQEIHEFIDRGNRIAEVNLSIEDAITCHRREIKKQLRQKILVNEYIPEHLKHALHNEIDISIDETIDKCKWTDFGKRPTSSPISKDTNTVFNCTCSTAVLKFGNIKKHVRASANVEIEVTKTINSYITTAKKTTCEQLKDQVNHQLFQNQKLNQMDDRIIPFLLKIKKPFSEFPINIQNKYSLEFWQTYTKNQDSYTTVGTKNIILKDILKAYKETPLINSPSRILNSPSQTDLGSIKAIKGFFIYDKLTSTQITDIKTSVSDKLLNLLKTRESYQSNDCSLAKGHIDWIILSLSKSWGSFRDEFRWEVHFYSMQLFLEIYENIIIKKLLNSGHDSLNSLLKKKNWLRMTYGFTFKGEGTVLAEYVIYAALQKAKKTAEQYAKQKLLNQSWIMSIENVRLSFFESLVEDINSKKYESALDYFQKPRETITNWFSEKVDNNTNNSEMLAKAADEWNHQVQDLWKKLENIPKNPQYSIKKIRYIFLQYLSEVDGIHYVSNFSMDNVSSSEAKEFCDALFKNITEKAQQQFTSLSFKKLSDSKSVKDKLGCTEFCYWCGALCWGHAGHNLNKDVTRKHHTCHQPQGLIGIVNEKNQRIVAETCENMDDDYCKLIRPGQPALTWRQIKLSNEFEDWIFINHSFDDFNNVMPWFFVKLNEQIAELYSAKPSEAAELKRIGYSDLEAKITGMLTNIKQQLQNSI